jgi:hypothetical protein
MSKVAPNTIAPLQVRNRVKRKEVEMHPQRSYVNHLRVWNGPKGQIRVTVEGDRTHLNVKPVWASPLSHPKHYLALLNMKNEEVALIKDPRDLDPKSLNTLQHELSRRYLTATVTRVIKANVEFGATYWNVETDRGPRDFVTQNLQENAQWLSNRHLLLIDVDGNRFEIPDVSALDSQSIRIIGTIV